MLITYKDINNFPQDLFLFNLKYSDDREINIEGIAKLFSLTPLSLCQFFLTKLIIGTEFIKYIFIDNTQKVFPNISTALVLKTLPF